jgi:hypothetical protein
VISPLRKNSVSRGKTLLQILLSSGGIFMPEFVLKHNRQGRINLVVEDLPSRVAHLYLQKAFEDNGKNLTFYPLAVSSLDFVRGRYSQIWHN